MGFRILTLLSIYILLLFGGTVKAWEKLPKHEEELNHIIWGRPSVPQQFPVCTDLSPSGRYLATGALVHSIKLFDMVEGKAILQSSAGNGAVWSTDFSPNERYLATGCGKCTFCEEEDQSIGGEVVLWDLGTIRGDSTYPTSWEVARFAEGTHKVTFSPDGRYLASAGGDGIIKLMKMPDCIYQQTLIHKTTFIDFGISPDCEYLVVLFHGGLDIWDISEFNCSLALEIVNIDDRIPKGSTSNPDAVAVEIGNTNYWNNDIPEVDYAINDATIFQEYLVKTFGLDKRNIIFETDANLAVFNNTFGTKDHPKGKLHRFVKPEKSDVFIYYCGHGAPDPDSKLGYFVPVDCDPSAVALNGYSLQTFYDNLMKIRARSVTVIIDACFSGQSDVGPLFHGISPVFIETTQGATLPNAIIFTSAQGNQVSTWYDEMKHGLFTYFFLKGLRSFGDENNDKIVTVGEMADYVQNRSDDVPYWAGRLKGREQIPTCLGDRERVLVKY